MRLMSCGLPSGSKDITDGDGERTMDGVRVCLKPVLSFGRESEDNDDFMSGSNKDFVSGSDDGKGAVEGSQSKPGLTIRFIVSPSFTLYSLRSLLSASAFPLSKRRCASARGARGWDASCDLIPEIESVGCTDSVKDCGGFNDLNVISMEATEGADGCPLGSGTGGSSIGRMGTFFGQS